MSSESVEKEVVGGNEFYDKAKEYWSNIQPTVDGVLGGFGHISQSDITGSEQFLRDVFKLDSAPGRGRALDCGAGIGRVTKHLLANFFAKVDLVDQNKDFVNKATEYVGEIPQIGNLYVAGLQEFQPTEKYDVIWCQWVLGHLTDDHLVEFFMKCQNSLAERGMIVIKENHTSSGELDVDEVDCSVTRPLDLIKKIVADAGLELLISRRQKNFPKGLYPVVMMALKPKTSDTLENSPS